MYEPYINREKQYLKMNADLDIRFKEIDTMKGDTTDIVKPRLNVGNGSKVNTLATKSVIHCPKQKRNENKCGTALNGSNNTATLDKMDMRETGSLIKSPSATIGRRQIAKVATSISFNKEIVSERKSTQNVNSKYSSVQADQSEIQSASVSSKSQDNTTAKKNISSEGLIKFLKSKVAILKQELEQSQQENVKNLRAYEGWVESNKKAAAQMELLTNENASLKDQIEKLQKANTVYESVITEKDADLATVNKELIVLKKQLKEINRLHNVLDKRFLKSQDDLEHLKKNLNISQDCERQQRAANQQQKNFFEDQIKLLSKQRTGLISAYKRQLLLLDNLKRQNLCLEQSKLLQLTEKDFMKILDWNS